MKKIIKLFSFALVALFAASCGADRTSAVLVEVENIIPAMIPKTVIIQKFSLPDNTYSAILDKDIALTWTSDSAILEVQAPVNGYYKVIPNPDPAATEPTTVQLTVSYKVNATDVSKSYNVRVCTVDKLRRIMSRSEMYAIALGSDVDTDVTVIRKLPDNGFYGITEDQEIIFAYGSSTANSIEEGDYVQLTGKAGKYSTRFQVASPTVTVMPGEIPFETPAAITRSVADIISDLSSANASVDKFHIMDVLYDVTGYIAKNGSAYSVCPTAAGGTCLSVQAQSGGLTENSKSLEQYVGKQIRTTVIPYSRNSSSTVVALPKNLSEIQIIA